MSRSEVVKQFLHPKSIAIVGASQDLTSIGGKPINNLIQHKYKGKIYPVNPKYQEICGYPCYPSILDIQGKIDVALIAVAASRILQTIEDCGKKEIRHLILFSSGFAETGPEGRCLQNELLQISRKHGIHIIGPNSIGCLNVIEKIPMGFSTSFESKKEFISGNIGLASQSGALGFSLFGLAQDENIGFSYIVNTGNQSDINVLDCISFMQQDTSTDVVAAYLEGVPDGEQLIELSKQSIKCDKPLLILKAGRSELGKKAAMSHTASLAGSEQAFNAIVKQFGLIPIRDIDDMIDTMKIFARGKRAKGSRIVTISNSGAAGITMADYSEQLDLELIRLQPETQEKIQSIIPVYGSAFNPIDITAQALNEQHILTETLEVLVKDDQVDVIIVHSTFGGTLGKKICEKIIDIDQKTDKPIIITLTGTKELMDEGRTLLQTARVPVYHTSYKTMAAVKQLVTFSSHVNAATEVQEETQDPMISPYEKKGVWTEEKVKQQLSDLGMIVPKGMIAKNREQLEQMKNKVQYPVVCKVISDEIIHKTDEGGVILGIKNELELIQAYESIGKSIKENLPEAKVNGILIEEMITEKGVEMFIGIKNDPQFGPLIVCGLGGIFIEVLKDISIRRAPITSLEAHSMLKELKGYSLLLGVRGGKKSDIDALANALVQLSHFADQNKGNIMEMDINPLIVLNEGKGVAALDGIVVWKNGKKEGDEFEIQNSHYGFVRN
ncbi:acetate--CoA ligase family protein [Peribacillus sp. NPDC097895]|uniref:acetate--CoA ligase family protein n=1 Tax=Peribacillus sp. NPDC097895 TaxID=3390619 RepID=UPI003D01E111